MEKRHAQGIHPKLDSAIRVTCGHVVTPSQIAWQSSGSPRVDGCVEHAGLCYVCVGMMTRGMPVAKWLGSNFTDQNRARRPTATHVCEACVYVHSRIAPVPGRPPKDGKKYGGSFRNYSHLWDEIGYVNASKGEKPAIREFLSRAHAGPWFAAIADSGQKHVLPFAPMNGPGRRGRVLFDEVVVQVPDDQSLVDCATDLLTAGATKDETLAGEYHSGTWQRCGEEIRAFESLHGSERGGGWFALAIWLAQRDETQVAARQAAEKEAKQNAQRTRKGKAAHADRGGDPRSQGSVSRKPGRKRAQALEPAGESSQSSGAHNIEPAGVADEVVPGPAATGPEQCGLPGIR